MSFETLFLRVSQEIATLTLSRPKEMNALSDQMLSELAEATAEIS